MKCLQALLVCFLLLSGTACKKELLTDEQQTAQTIQSIVSERSITQATVYVGTSQRQFKVPFTIEGNLLVLPNVYGKQYYSLSKLIQFETSSNGNNGTLIIFYF